MISIDIDARDLTATLNRLDSEIADFSRFFRWWYREGDIQKVQERWFRSGGPTGTTLSPFTVSQRAAGLRRSNPASDNFYQATSATSGVSASRPRFVWTGHTMRSTWVPFEADRSQARVRSENVPITDTAYPRFGGPFTDSIPDERIWDLQSLDRALDVALEFYFAETAESGAPR